MSATVRLLPSAAGLGLRNQDELRTQSPGCRASALAGARVEESASINHIAGREPVSSPGMSCIAAGAGATPRPTSVGRAYSLDNSLSGIACLLPVVAHTRTFDCSRTVNRQARRSREEQFPYRSLAHEFGRGAIEACPRNS